MGIWKRVKRRVTFDEYHRHFRTGSAFEVHQEFEKHQHFTGKEKESGEARQPAKGVGP